jgi:hypothetical protein
MTMEQMMCAYLSVADWLMYKATVFLRLIPQNVAQHIPLPAKKNNSVIIT